MINKAELIYGINLSIERHTSIYNQLLIKSSNAQKNRDKKYNHSKAMQERAHIIELKTIVEALDEL